MQSEAAEVAMKVTVGALLVVFALAASPAWAHQFEVHPYAGAFFPGKWVHTKNLHKEGIYGVRAGVFVTENVEVDGNFGYLNHFRFEGAPDLGTQGFLWDFNGRTTCRGRF
jgi:hypothetical protein